MNQHPPDPLHNHVNTDIADSLYYYVNTEIIDDSPPYSTDWIKTDPNLQDLVLHSDALTFEEKIGGGFFGVVYKGQCQLSEGIKWEVALKKIVLNHFRSTDQLHLFLKEVDIWRYKSSMNMFDLMD